MKKLFLILILVSTVLMLNVPLQTSADKTDDNTLINISEISTNLEKGQYSFVININSDEMFAGAEFGAFCSTNTKITAIESDSGCNVGPTEANGLTWFGFFDGENYFSNASFTIQGTFDPKQESLIKISDIKVYSIEDNGYSSLVIDQDITAEINSINNNINSTDANNIDALPENSTNYLVCIVSLLILILVVVTAVAILIYKYKKKMEKSNDN